MNERIKELYNKAWSKVDPRNPQETFTQAFAELIVRECIDTLDKEVYLATREDGEQSHIDVILLEHFGVE